jgi:DNA-directed RNA polymerase subunit omega
MARVTIEDCLKNVDNMYELVHLATKRARQLYKGSDPLVKSKNRVIVTSLREIAAGKVLTDQPKANGAGANDLDDLLPLSN